MAKHERGLRFQPTGGSRAPQIPVGKKQRLTIERLANDGRGIVFFEGRTWFVVGALAGEEVEARVLGAHGKVVEARTERVFSASALRRPAPCVHAGRCGGCSLQHLPHDEQLALKQRMLAEQLSRVAGVEPQEWAAPLSGPEFGYRRRARVAVRWDAKAKKLEVGFRAVASQDIVAIDDCPVLVQALQPIMQRLPNMLRRLSKPQALGHVELFSGSSIAVLLRHMAPLSLLCSLRVVYATHKSTYSCSGFKCTVANLIGTDRKNGSRTVGRITSKMFPDKSRPLWGAFFRLRTDPKTAAPASSQAAPDPCTRQRSGHCAGR